MEKAQEILQKYFGYSTFRPGQEIIIKNIMNQRDTLGIMPTGGGKSLCYQIPAMLFPGTTLVISPLISLMKDQVDSLKDLGMPADFINSSLKQRDVEARIAKAAAGEYKMLYIAPERLASEDFRALLTTLPVSLLAVDEAHCISQWGHDFRPSYRAIPYQINELPQRPVVVAFTATATEEVTKDIVKLLEFKKPVIHITGFDRPNLHYSVNRGVNKNDYLLNYIDAHREQAGIVYAATRREVESIHKSLLDKGIVAGKYHAGLKDLEREEMQENFANDDIRVMVATNAFGMGIDKSNVRYVIHYNMPKNMESYYQEAGRAARDGEPGECILLFGPRDTVIQKYLIEQTMFNPARKQKEYSKLQTMVDYCYTSRCLRQFILTYFGEKGGRDKKCGNCGSCSEDWQTEDITVDAQKIFSCIHRLKGQYGITMVASVLQGSKAKKTLRLRMDRLSTYGIMKEYSVKRISDLINMLVAEQYLTLTEGKFPVVKLRPEAVPVLKGEAKVEHKVLQKKRESVVNQDLFERLRSLRKQISQKEGVPPYVVFSDRTLREMAEKLPVNRESLLAINGVGEVKYSKYGHSFIELIKEEMLNN